MGERAMILEVRHLRILTAIADHGTVSAATKHVYLTQSAISHQLIELEQRLGIHFFHRTPKGMVPTEAGAELIEVARDVLARLAAAEASMLRTSPRSAGRLRVGTDSPLALAWLPAAVSIVRRRLPHIRAELVPDTTAHGVDALFEGRYELAVVADAAPDPRLDLIPLFDEELVALVTPAHRLAGRLALGPGDLRVEQLAVHAARPKRPPLAHREARGRRPGADAPDDSDAHRGDRRPGGIRRGRRDSAPSGSGRADPRRSSHGPAHRTRSPAAMAAHHAGDRSECAARPVLRFGGAAGRG
jgi:DNA-binding transcriptional LysR family regulator